ncbi:hypothetical protein RCH07_003694, partial [Arthrobacter sp. CG_A4]|nr:hypothetical protein [Arthrobacter sp. CG_A4]
AERHRTRPRPAAAAAVATTTANTANGPRSSGSPAGADNSLTTDAPKRPASSNSPANSNAGSYTAHPTGHNGPYLTPRCSQKRVIATPRHKMPRYKKPFALHVGSGALRLRVTWFCELGGNPDDAGQLSARLPPSRSPVRSV